jgi:hypothetical protein
MTLSNLISKIKSLSENHPMIKTFGEGDIYDYVDNGGEIQYPVLWVVIQPSNYNRGNMNYNLLLLFADLLIEDKSNVLQVQSDELQVAIDLISKLKLDSTYNFNVSDNVSIEFFEERFDDFTAGVTANIQVNAPLPLDYCQIPS